VGISVPGESSATGRVIDITAEGVAVRIPSAAGLALREGEGVVLTFAGSRFPLPITTPGVVKYHLPEGPTDRFGLEFADKASLEKALGGQSLHFLFNRRKSFRVAPEKEPSIAVTLRRLGEEKRTVARLVDISEGGLSVSVGRESDPGYADRESLEVSLLLPVRDGDIRLRATLRHRRIVGGRIRFGMEIDVERTEDWKRQLGAIREFVAQRQQTMLRRRIR
jgi:hypothetical protein